MSLAEEQKLRRCAQLADQLLSDIMPQVGMLVIQDYADLNKLAILSAELKPQEPECTHIWRYTGHGHNYSLYRCDRCGAEKEE